MANPLEHQLQYPLGEAIPAPGATLDIVPGVRWLRMGLPFALDHINLWLLRDEIDGRAGWTVVDCGVANDATRGAWEQVFANELQGLPVLRVVVTHMHPDHVGLAHWLTERWSTREGTCRLWMSATDWTAACVASASTTGHGGEAAARFFASHGLSDPFVIEKVMARGHYYSGLVPRVPASFRRLMDGLTLSIGGRAWACRVGYGHAPEHISLVCAERGLMIAGDMVLPRISTNVSVMDMEPEADPIGLYLASLDRLSDLPADTLVLPSHGKPFRGLHARIAQLHAHHDERFAEVLACCAAVPRSAVEVLPVLFTRALDLHQTTFALGETIAHLNGLWLRGRLRRSVDAAGVFRFVAA
jgi:glyoxylase-like metal-dependent hydrolase (beta-lactamase superfamily II)